MFSALCLCWWVHAHLCVIGLYEMEKAGTGLYRVGVVVR